jgi:hypothetical protein
MPAIGIRSLSAAVGGLPTAGSEGFSARQKCYQNFRSIFRKVFPCCELRNRGGSKKGYQNIARK